MGVYSLNHSCCMPVFTSANKKAKNMDRFWVDLYYHGFSKKKKK